MCQHYNLAEKSGDISLSSNEKCVFISHKKEDENVAKKIGDFLMKEVGVNIYLDTQDCELKEAVSENNDKKIVKSIKTGLECSTHLLCLISDKTRLSWWVPYEIGYAEKKEIDIASLKLKTINEDDIPSFLKVKNVLYDRNDFNEYVSKEFLWSTFKIFMGGKLPDCDFSSVNDLLD